MTQTQSDSGLCLLMVTVGDMVAGGAAFKLISWRFNHGQALKPVTVDSEVIQQREIKKCYHYGDLYLFLLSATDMLEQENQAVGYGMVSTATQINTDEVKRILAGVLPQAEVEDPNFRFQWMLLDFINLNAAVLMEGSPMAIEELTGSSGGGNF